MKVIQHIQKMQEWSEAERLTGNQIGFVPTMGALHEGHLSLVRQAKKENKFCVVSLFVNPLQFGKGEDFEKYPRDFEADFQKLKEGKVDLLFTPYPEDIYPTGYKSYVSVDEITTRLCGKFRPGHFRGVTTVVAKLFNMVKPHRAYFGEKDYQQAMVIKKMVTDLNLDLKIITLPIIRDENGLALSSRNAYLNKEEYKQALALNMALKYAQGLVHKGEEKSLLIKNKIKSILEMETDLVVDYISICDPLNFMEVNEIREKTLIALRVKIGQTNLIDNCIVGGID